MQGAIAVEPPLAIVEIGAVPDVAAKHWCGQATLQTRFDLPRVPAGVDVRFQLLSLDDYARQTGPVPALSRATEVRML